MAPLESKAQPSKPEVGNDDAKEKDDVGPNQVGAPVEAYSHISLKCFNLFPTFEALVCSRLFFGRKKRKWQCQYFLSHSSSDEV